MSQALAHHSLDELDKILKRYKKNMEKEKQGCARNKNPNITLELGKGGAIWKARGAAEERERFREKVQDTILRWELKQKDNDIYRKTNDELYCDFIDDLENLKEIEK